MVVRAAHRRRTEAVTIDIVNDVGEGRVGEGWHLG
jgi:hypothetical protein